MVRWNSNTEHVTILRILADEPATSRKISVSRVIGAGKAPGNFRVTNLVVYRRCDGMVASRQ